MTYYNFEQFYDFNIWTVFPLFNFHFHPHSSSAIENNLKTVQFYKVSQLGNFCSESLGSELWPEEKNCNKNAASARFEAHQINCIHLSHLVLMKYFIIFYIKCWTKRIFGIRKINLMIHLRLHTLTLFDAIKTWYSSHRKREDIN